MPAICFLPSNAVGDLVIHEAKWHKSCYNKFSTKLYQLRTFQSDSVSRMAKDLQDTSLLAKIEGGDLIILEPKSWLAKLSNRVIPFKISHFQPPSHIDHLGFCSEIYYRLLWIPYERIPSYSVQLKLIWKLRPFIIWVPHPLFDNSVKRWRL